ncbi:MAG: sulfatase activating formylglycine-generating enzyme [Neolewinella sp.]|jgi:formylglycine-generating enzyme required for sulfatase activity
MLKRALVLMATMHAMGWYTHNDTGMGYTTGTKPVAKKQPNAWGLYDMHGNVYEWNWDWHAAYELGNITDPSGPASGSGRVIRGGGWGNGARDSRSAIRSSTSAGFVSATWVSGLFCPKASSQVA